MNSEVPIRILSIGSKLNREEHEQLKLAIEDALNQSTIDGPIVIINEEVEAITKEDLKEILEE